MNAPKRIRLLNEFLLDPNEGEYLSIDLRAAQEVHVPAGTEFDVIGNDADTLTVRYNEMTFEVYPLEYEVVN